MALERGFLMMTWPGIAFGKSDSLTTRGRISVRMYILDAVETGITVHNLEYYLSPYLEGTAQPLRTVSVVVETKREYYTYS